MWEWHRRHTLIFIFSKCLGRGLSHETSAEVWKFKLQVYHHCRLKEGTVQQQSYLKSTHWLLPSTDNLFRNLAIANMLHKMGDRLWDQGSNCDTPLHSSFDRRKIKAKLNMYSFDILLPMQQKGGLSTINWFKCQ